MQYKYLRGTGAMISRVSLGSTTFGDQLDYEGSCAVLDAAVDHGINMIDTGNQYAGGESERVIGRWLESRGNRDKVIIGTKVDLPTGDGVNERGASRLNIMNAVENSLRALRTDYIDIYYLHHPDRNTPLEETLDTMSCLVRSGKVRYIGFSNYSAWEACDMMWTAKTNGFVVPKVAQNVYNLLTRGADDEFAYFLRKHNVGFVIYNPLAGGLLTGKHTRDHIAEGSRFNSKMYQDRYWNDKNFDAIDILKGVAEEAGISLVELATRWCLSNDFVDSVMMGFSKLTQLEQNIAAVEKGPLAPDVVKACDKAWDILKCNAYPYFVPPKGSKGSTGYTGSLSK